MMKDWEQEVNSNKKGMGRCGSANGGLGSDIKFAGNDNKMKMYEPKHRRKMVRVLTVVAYIFSVSLAAIILSLFYMFIYNPGKSFESTKEFHFERKGFMGLSNETNFDTESEEPIALPLSKK